MSAESQHQPGDAGQDRERERDPDDTGQAAAQRAKAAGADAPPAAGSATSAMKQTVPKASTVAAKCTARVRISGSITLRLGYSPSAGPAVLRTDAEGEVALRAMGVHR